MSSALNLEPVERARPYPYTTACAPRVVAGAHDKGEQNCELLTPQPNVEGYDLQGLRTPTKNE